MEPRHDDLVLARRRRHHRARLLPREEARRAGAAVEHAGSRLSADADPQALAFRRAVAGDAAALGALAQRSKAHWGYDAAFLEVVRPALTYDPAELACRSAYVAERAGRIVAFYVFSTLDGERFLDDFWVDAPFIGRGIGACLWRHAVETARADGDAAFFIESDPNAAGFYERMGAVRAGERVSPATGRTLPLMRFALA